MYIQVSSEAVIYILLSHKIFLYRMNMGDVSGGETMTGCFRDKSTTMCPKREVWNRNRKGG